MFRCYICKYQAKACYTCYKLKQAFELGVKDQSTPENLRVVLTSFSPLERLAYTSGCSNKEFRI